MPQLQYRDFALAEGRGVGAGVALRKNLTRGVTFKWFQEISLRKSQKRNSDPSPLIPARGDEQSNDQRKRMSRVFKDFHRRILTRYHCTPPVAAPAGAAHRPFTVPSNEY
jgi:hypothetical protein